MAGLGSVGQQLSGWQDVVLNFRRQVNVRWAMSGTLTWVRATSVVQWAAAISATMSLVQRPFRTLELENSVAWVY